MSFATSYVTLQPELLLVTADVLQAIGAGVAAEDAAAAAPTTGVVPAAADEVSALTATQFAAHAAAYQVVSARAGAVHALLVETLRTSADSYATTEAANVIAAS